MGPTSPEMVGTLILLIPKVTKVNGQTYLGTNAKSAGIFWLSGYNKKGHCLNTGSRLGGQNYVNLEQANNTTGLPPYLKVYKAEKLT